MLSSSTQRQLILFRLFFFGLLLVIFRLFYWQVVKAKDLKSIAQSQHFSQDIISPNRGKILAADDFPLVINQPRYRLFAYTPNLNLSPRKLTDILLQQLDFKLDDPALATDPAKLQQKTQQVKQQFELKTMTRLTTKKWTPLATDLSLQEKESLDKLGIKGLSFQETFKRFYPEASMSAHLLGFVGKDKLGRPKGFYGLEGYYDKELRGSQGIIEQEKDAFGHPLLTGTFNSVLSKSGRDLKLYLDRSLQFQIEQALRQGLKLYGAKAGEVVVMDPWTGGILAMASLPSYDPARYWAYDTSLYKNPVIADTYEPGSTFKVLVMSAALQEHVVKPSDHCDICGAPVKIGKYYIRTWDNKYEAGRTPEQILVHSDNVGMVWVQRKLGEEKLLKYLKLFGFGQKTGIDLQEETEAPLKKHWTTIDYATAAFGQGIAVTSIQMVRAVSAIANGGNLVEPHVVREVIDDHKTEVIKSRIIRRVLDKKTTDLITQMMIASAEHGEAKWTALKEYEVAGKTGTAQISIAGHYDDKKTIASFIGFAPAKHPRFVMLVKLTEPQSSPWGSETAAPLWFHIAKKILIHLNIPPSNN